MHNQAQLGVDFLNYTDKSMIASKIYLWNKKRWKEWENNTLTLKEYILALWFLSKLNNTKKISKSCCLSTFTCFSTIHGSNKHKENQCLELQAVSEKWTKDNRNLIHDHLHTEQTYIVFIWVVFLMICENRDFFDPAVLSKGVCFWWEWKDGLIIRRKARKT